MYRNYIKFLIQLILLLVSCHAMAANDSKSTSNTNSIPEDNVVKAAALQYAISNSAYKKFNVKVIKIYRDFSKLTVTPTDEVGDTATIYMKKQNGKWCGIYLGTYPETYELNIPEEVW